MNPRELRLGNLLLEEKTNRIASIIGLTDDSITVSGTYYGEWQVKPLSIHEDILINLGFKMKKLEVNTFFCFEDGCFTYVLSESGKIGTYFIEIKDTETGNTLTGFGSVSSVHELQNKIFMFNHTELTLSF